jgi:ABC-2 type transport system ATP-binding protein
MLAALSLIYPSVPAHAQDKVIETELMVPGTPEADGEPVKLDTTILTTDPATPRPAIVLAHGFGGTKADSEPTARTLALAGYTVIIYTARGFGASGGLIHLDNPGYEGADARKLIDLAASRPEVAKDGDDPVIGFAGASYGGALSFLAAGLDPRVDAIAPAFTWHSLREALFPASGCGCGQVTSRCQSREPPGGLQAALGLAAVLQRRRTTGCDQPGGDEKQRQRIVRSIRPGTVPGISHRR